MIRTEKLRERIVETLRRPIKIDLVGTKKLQNLKQGRNERADEILKACKEAKLTFPDGSEIDLETTTDLTGGHWEPVEEIELEE